MCTSLYRARFVRSEPLLPAVARPRAAAMDYHYSTARALDPERVQMEGSPWSPAGEALRGEVSMWTSVAPDPGRVEMEGSPWSLAGSRTSFRM